MHQVDS